MLTKKQILFYVLVFIIFYMFARGGITISEYLHVNVDIILIFISLLFTLLCYFVKDSNVYSKDPFHFELTPEKHCLGGKYMYSSDPEKMKFCSQFSQGDMSNYECPPGFHGMPVWWNRDTMSNNNWENKMCDTDFNKYDEQRVL
jgi:hypothetical protein